MVCFSGYVILLRLQIKDSSRSAAICCASSAGMPIIIRSGGSQGFSISFFMAVPECRLQGNGPDAPVFPKKVFRIFQVQVTSERQCPCSEYDTYVGIELRIQF